MKVFLTLAFSVAAAHLVHAAEMPAPAPVAAAPGRIVTTDGRTFEDVRGLRVKPDGLSFIHREGAATVPFTVLPESLRQAYGYSPDKAAEYAKQKSAEAVAAANAEAAAAKAQSDALAAKAGAENLERLRWAQWVADHQDGGGWYCPPSREAALKAAATAKYLRDGAGKK